MEETEEETVVRHTREPPGQEAALWQLHSSTHTPLHALVSVQTLNGDHSRRAVLGAAPRTTHNLRTGPPTPDKAQAEHRAAVIFSLNSNPRDANAGAAPGAAQAGRARSPEGKACPSCLCPSQPCLTSRPHC